MSMTGLLPGGPRPAAPATPPCEAIREFPGIKLPCSQPAIGLFRRICVHEHVRDGWLCPGHTENPNGLCRACRELPGGLSHECPIAIAIITTALGGTE